MQRKSIPIAAFVIVLLIALLYIYNYYTTKQITLSEPQIIACYAADEGNTCFTKLPELDFVSPETCCKALEACC